MLIKMTEKVVNHRKKTWNVKLNRVIFLVICGNNFKARLKFIAHIDLR